MQSQSLLPISNPFTPSSTMIPTSSSIADTMLLTSQPNMPSTIVLDPCTFDDDSKIETIPFISLNLLRYLGVGYRWITMFLALGCYVFLLIPGFIQVGYHYFSSSQVRRDIVYGDQPRNSNKAWGSLLGQQLSERDIIVECIDYRNFPQGTISDMVKDVSQGISFVCNNIANYGGDPSRIYLMGQSAGAHFVACALLEQAIKQAAEKERDSWSVSQIKAYFGLSGG